MKTVHLIFICLIIFVSCKKAEIQPKDFPVIITKNIEDNSSNGAMFNAEIIQHGTSAITSYGFIWHIADLTAETFSIDLGNNLPEDKFQAYIDSTLAKGFEYKFRAYVKIGSRTIYGNEVAFISKGSKFCRWSKEADGIILGNTYGNFHNRIKSYSNGNKIYVSTGSHHYEFLAPDNQFVLVSHLPSNINEFEYAKYEDWRDDRRIISFSINSRIFKGFSHGFHSGYDDNTWLENNLMVYDEDISAWKNFERFPFSLPKGDLFYFVLNDDIYLGYAPRFIYTLYKIDLNKE